MPSSESRLLLSEQSEKEGRLQCSGRVDDGLCCRLEPRFLCLDSDKFEGSGASPSLLSSEEEEEEEESCIRGGGSRHSAGLSPNKELRPPNSFCRRPFRSRV